MKAPKQHSFQAPGQFVVPEASGVRNRAVLEELHAVPSTTEWLSIGTNLFQAIADGDGLGNVGSALRAPLAVCRENRKEDEWTHRRSL